MSSSKLVVQGAAGALGGESLNVEDVFSTYLYTGNGSTNTITNGIDLDGEGGLTWIKVRTNANSSRLFDTERGAGKYLETSATTAEQTLSGQGISAFNSNGFTLIGSNNPYNSSSHDYASWTFRKAPKFFDVVTYTGDGDNSREIPHNLGCIPGAIFCKRLDTTSNWTGYHIQDDITSSSLGLSLNLTDDARFTGVNSTTRFTSTMFKPHELYDPNTANRSNVSGATYVAYLFAHNDGDGEFGPDGDADIIKCGSYTGNTGGAITETLGFEPQWLLVKNATASANWVVLDTMRNMSWDAANAGTISANANYAEQDVDEPGAPRPEATGFGLASGNNYAEYNFNTNTYIYIAIRRGPMAVPDDADDVFAVTTQSGSTAPAHDTGFVTDFSLRRENGLSSASIIHAVDRLRGKYYLSTEGTNAEIGLTNNTWDFMDGWFGAGSDDSNKYAWSWKRAPNYFDVVAYTGNGSAGRTVSHNLGVTPEMMWVKSRDDGYPWPVYHKDLTSANKYLNLNDDAPEAGSTNRWNNTAPTASVFTLGSGTNTNKNGSDFIAYLFASLDGVSKVGSYTGNGTSQTIDCGFSAGARFVLIKKTSGTGSWLLYDTERGIVAGNDSQLYLDGTFAADSVDNIDPDNSGFIATGSTNTSGETYIFYAIA